MPFNQPEQMTPPEAANPSRDLAGNAIPSIDGPWELLASAPDLTQWGFPHGKKNLGNGANEPNDHTIFQDASGAWNLWACVRRTSVGRILCHWRADSLFQSPWRLTGNFVRASKLAGESLVEWQGEEFIQSPFVVRDARQFWMFYGGYDTGFDRKGLPTVDYGEVEKQLCLMTSPDGITWTRHRDRSGFSRVFVGPGAVRDPGLLFDGDRWYCYYCGHSNGDRTRGDLFVRSSKDLLHWDEAKVVQHGGHKSLSTGSPIILESPFVVKHTGLYYLFRSHGQEDGTYVYASPDPMNFETSHHGPAVLVAFFPRVIAAEVIREESGRSYISTIRHPGRDVQYGVWMAPLVWK